MGFLLGLLANQPEATKRTYWARHWAVALDAIQLVAAAQGSLPLEDPGREDGGDGSSSSSSSRGEGRRSWIQVVILASSMLSDATYAPGEVKP